MILKNYKALVAMLVISAALVLAFAQTGCGVYKFKDVSIPDSVKVVRVGIIQNKASYVNPQLAPELTERLKQKIVSQTRMKQTNGDDADWDINCTITSYSFSTSGISNQRANTNRLNVGVHIDVRDNHSQQTKKYDVTRSFDYDGSLALQQAEQGLKSEMLRSLSDDIFNRIFSNW
ncbi:LPS assembly lipoprotein LptE [Niabella sp. CC-SYL272]|uniref:LPS assembly lipoprotein LptE n=1 Tax=Niabella agricola TaxID=2891571 RepID=UPI001F1A1AE9|nr:LPS assembly lipoprotein LptE [Niabella agricola]MCF3107231.1 LPS assembly lipoprotein LptE [Niabella agricola]